MANKNKRQNRNVKNPEVEAAKAVAAQTAANAEEAEVRNDDVIVLPPQNVNVVEETTETPVAEETAEVSEETTGETTEVSEEATEETAEVSEEATEETAEVSEEATEETAEVSEEATEETAKVSEEATEETAEVSEEATEETAEVSEEATEETVEVSEEATEETVEVSEEATEETAEVSEEATEETVEVSEEGIEDDDIAEVMAIVNKRKQPVETPVEEPAKETPSEEVSNAEPVAEEAPVEESTKDSKQEKEKKENSEKKIPLIAKVLGGIATCFLGVIAIALVIMLCRGGMSPSVDINGTTGPSVTLPPETTAPIQQPETTAPVETTTPVQVDLLKDFEKSTINIAKQISGEDVTAEVYTWRGSNSDEKLEALVKEFGAFNVQKATATAFTRLIDARVKMYAKQQGFAENAPTSYEEYEDYLEFLTDDYKETYGVNPETEIMTLDGYETYKAYRVAIIEMIEQQKPAEQAQALKEWYIMSKEGYDIAKKCEDFRATVKGQVLTSAGTITFIEMQLRQGVVALDENYDYTDQYYNFVVNNYMIIAAAAN